MKNKYNYIFCGIVMLSGILSGCKKDKWADLPNTTISAVTYTAPDDKVSVTLDPASNAVVTFQWQPAQTANHTLSYYQVVFDKDTGNFSHPVYTGIPDAGGTKTSLVLTHRILNKIASLAGIPALQKGKIQWKVIASNGVVTSQSEESRTMELQRPAGFAENPADVFLTGSATEAGTDLSKALKFKKLSDGVFELYTSLSLGSFKLVDKNTGSPATFIWDGTALKDGTDANSPASATTTYRINLNFNTAAAQLTQIQEVGLWFAGYNAVTNVLSYTGNGIWKASDITIVFSAQSWGKDERYKFRVVEKDMAGMVTNRLWASSTKDKSKPTSSTASSYFYLASNDNSQWDYTYKFEKEAAKADIFVKFQASDTYTHQVVFK